MKSWRDGPPIVIPGLEWYYLHRVKGRIHNVLYRPIKGPWTDALKRRCPTAWRGRAKDKDEVTAAPAPPAVERPPSRRARESAVRAELKARQGNLL